MVSIDWNPTVKKLREFGFVTVIGFLLIGFILGLINSFEFIGVYLAAVGVAFGVLTAIVPRLMKWFYFLWMGIAFILGNIIGRILLIFIYYVVCLLIAFIMKCVGRDKLELKRKNRATYWKGCAEADADKAIYERQF